MKAIGYIHSLPPSDPKSLFDFELPKPTPGPRDLLVAVRAVSVNPVDTKVRMRAQGTEAQPKILGFDCAGVAGSSGDDGECGEAPSELHKDGAENLRRAHASIESHKSIGKIVLEGF